MQLKFPYILLVSLSLFVLTWMASCSKEDPLTNGNYDISFSHDTLSFDTVFTAIGSATKRIKIYNNLPSPIVLPEITLSDGGQFFRMNVDGISGNSVKDVLIQANDSIYVFVEVTIDPNMPLSVSPFIIEEALQINAGTDIYTVVLEAWGQNANYFPSRFSARNVNLLSCNLGSFTWDDPKPYVIYGVLAIDSCELVIPPGARIYIHGGIVRNNESIYNDGLLLFLANGKLTVNGTVENPVIFQGDRLESEFQNISGQWAGIRFISESRDHTIKNTIIKNSIIGLRVDSLASLTVEQTQIYNSASSGLISYAGDIKASNCLFYNNGSYGMQLVNGGNYEISYCTFANYNNRSEAIALTNYLCTDPLCQEEIVIFPLSASITNCIMDGNNDKEFLIDDLFDGANPAFFEVSISHNLIKHDEPENHAILKDCNNCTYLFNQDPLFVKREENNYQLDTMSIARDIGISIPGINIDILGHIRNLNTPDVGCYEFVE